jgi:uncharacterized protein (UPF0335 family)
MTEAEAVQRQIDEVLVPRKDLNEIEKDLTDEMKEAGFNVKAVKAAAAAKFREQEEEARETAETLVELLSD